MTKPSEYSDESRLEVRPAHAKYLFVYPFVKTRAWYRLSPEERYRVMQEHIRIGREYPTIDLNTTYSFGLDDQEFVVAFETDDPADFLDLVQRLRTTESSEYTKRDTPDVHVHRRVGRARAGRARRRGADPRAPAVAVTTEAKDLARDFDEVRDITVIGAGPVGLSTAFWAGMREASSARSSTRCPSSAASSRRSTRRSGSSTSRATRGSSPRTSSSSCASRRSSSSTSPCTWRRPRRRSPGRTGSWSCTPSAATCARAR